MFAGGRDFRRLLLSALVVVQPVVPDLDRVTLTQARVARAVVSKDLLALPLAEPIVHGDRRPRLPVNARGDCLVIAVFSRAFMRGPGLGAAGGTCMAPTG